MKKAKDKLTAMLNAMTFAEAGEHETAMEFMRPQTGNDDASHERAEASADTPGFLEKLERDMVEATLAEAKEYRTWRDLARPGAAPKVVVLISDGRWIEPAAFSHALSLCRRLPARLEIVAFTPAMEGGPDSEDSKDTDAVKRRLNEWSGKSEAQGVACSVDIFPGSSKSGLLTHIRSRKRIAALVDGIGLAGENRRPGFHVGAFLERVAHRLCVPVIKVTQKTALQD